MLLAVAAVLGFVSVAFGAYTEHALQKTVSEEVFRFLMTAIRYNQVHALAAAGVGLALLTQSRAPAVGLMLAGWGFVLGTLLFSGGIYAAALTGVEALNYLAPAGGVTFMMAWLTLAVTGVLASRAR